MKKCNDCNIEMVTGELFGSPRHIDMNNDIDKFYFDMHTGEKGNFLGLKYDKTKRYSLNAYVCPKCGKIEFYINPEEKSLINL